MRTPHPPSTRLAPPASLILFALAAPAGAGCSGTAIREGIWELKVHNLMRMENREVLEIPVRRVRVLVEPVVDERKPEHIENVEVAPLAEERDASGGQGSDPDRRIGRTPFYAEVHRRNEGETVFLVLAGKDESWRFQMAGVVKDDTTIVGRRISARPLFTSDATFEGTWTLKWVSDE
ncbi:MAG: hypothetical protein HY721_04660 [Planctomycetes bacterium]|nr:hypothetical protein [Planctomycetota bacterium]